MSSPVIQRASEQDIADTASSEINTNMDVPGLQEPVPEQDPPVASTASPTSTAPSSSTVSLALHTSSRASTPSSDSNDSKSRLLSLAMELRIMVLCRAPDTKTLLAVLATCKKLHAIYEDKTKDILCSVVLNELGVNADLAVLLQTLPIDIDADPREILHALQTFFTSPPQVDLAYFEVEQLEEMSKFHHCIEALTDALIEQFCRNKKVAASLAIRPITRTERARIHRAFYLFEILRRLMDWAYKRRINRFKKNSGLPYAVSELFLGILSAVENEQLRTVIEFGLRQGCCLWNYAVQYDIEHAVRYGEQCNIAWPFWPLFPVETHDFWDSETYLRRGCEGLLELVHVHRKPINADNHEARMALKHVGLRPCVSGLYFSHLVDNDFFAKQSTLLQGQAPVDTDPGPRNAMVYTRQVPPRLVHLANNHDAFWPAALGAGTHLWMQRESGYVFFDAARISTPVEESGLPHYGFSEIPEGHFRTDAVCISLDHLNLDQLQRLIHDRLPVSIDLRRQAHQQGLRGFWSWGNHPATRDDMIWGDPLAEREQDTDNEALCELKKTSPLRVIYSHRDLEVAAVDPNNNATHYIMVDDDFFDEEYGRPFGKSLLLVPGRGHDGYGNASGWNWGYIVDRKKAELKVKPAAKAAKVETQEDVKVWERPSDKPLDNLWSFEDLVSDDIREQSFRFWALRQFPGWRERVEQWRKSLEDQGTNAAADADARAMDDFARTQLSLPTVPVAEVEDEGEEKEVRAKYEPEDEDLIEL